MASACFLLTKTTTGFQGQLGSLGISGQNARLVGHNHVIMAQSVRSWLLHVDLIVLYKEGDKVVPAVLTVIQIVVR